MDSFDADLFTALNVDIEVIDEDGFLWLHPKLLQSNLVDLRFGLCRTHLRRDDHLVEGIVELFPDDEVAQVAPGVRDESCFVVAAQRRGGIDQRPVNDIACEEFIADERKLRSRAFQSFHDRCPMVIGSDLTHRCLDTAVAIEDDLAQVVIFHAKPFGELLARRLILCADDDSAKIEEDGADAHLLFFDVPLVADFLQLLFFVSADGVVWRAAVFGLDSSAGTASGFGLRRAFFSGSRLRQWMPFQQQESILRLAEAPPAAGAPSSPFQTPSAHPASWASPFPAADGGCGVARRQRGQCAS